MRAVDARAKVLQRANDGEHFQLSSVPLFLCFCSRPTPIAADAFFALDDLVNIASQAIFAAVRAHENGLIEVDRVHSDGVDDRSFELVERLLMLWLPDSVRIEQNQTVENSTELPTILDVSSKVFEQPNCLSYLGVVRHATVVQRWRHLLHRLDVIVVGCSPLSGDHVPEVLDRVGQDRHLARLDRVVTRSQLRQTRLHVDAVLFQRRRADNAVVDHQNAFAPERVTHGVIANALENRHCILEPHE